MGRCTCDVESIRLTLTLADNGVEAFHGSQAGLVLDWGALGAAQSKADLAGLARVEGQLVCIGELCACGIRAHGIFLAIDNKAMKGIFGVGGDVVGSKECLEVGLIVGVQRFWCAQRFPVCSVGCGHGKDGERLESVVASGGRQKRLALERGTLDRRLARAALVAAAPHPRVAEPKSWQHIDRCRRGARVGDTEPRNNIVVILLGILGDHIPHALLQHSRVFQLVLGVRARAAAVGLDQRRIRELGLRVLVQCSHVAVRGGRVEVVVELLAIFAMVALGAGEPKEALLQDRILVVPESDAKTKPALTVTDAKQSILSPPICTRASVIVRKIPPACTIGRVVLAHSAPLPLRKIWSPPLPVFLASSVLCQPRRLAVHVNKRSVTSKQTVVPIGTFKTKSQTSKQEKKRHQSKSKSKEVSAHKPT
eukprot:m.189738 g.189738  ORF g.189738 m.189738 type:complete len:423 (-) comp15433_c0_seq5:99-1367(-)